jgi:hypothetical protein
MLTLSDQKVYDAHRPMRLGPDFAPSPSPQRSDPLHCPTRKPGRVTHVALLKALPLDVQLHHSGELHAWPLD